MLRLLLVERSVINNTLEANERPIKDGGCADMSTPIGSISLRGIYVYYVYGHLYVCGIVFTHL